MNFERIASPVNRVIAALGAKIAEQQRAANAVADKIGTDQHTKYLGAEHELHAEAAQVLAGKQAAFENLRDTGWLK